LTGNTKLLSTATLVGPDDFRLCEQSLCRSSRSATDTMIHRPKQNGSAACPVAAQTSSSINAAMRLIIVGIEPMLYHQPAVPQPQYSPRDPDDAEFLPQPRD
jgi:hypothetical protein